MKQVGILVACGALALAFGCDSSDSGGDDGGIRLMDGGGRDSGPTTRPDSGPPDAGPTRACEMDLMPLPPQVLPRCSAETRTCLSACTDGACVSNCLMMDQTPPLTQNGVMLNCAFCISYQQEACFEMNGSAREIHAVRCCAADNNCMSQSCVQTNCSAQLQTAMTSAAARTCLVVPTTGPYAGCFAP